MTDLLPLEEIVAGISPDDEQTLRALTDADIDATNNGTTTPGAFADRVASRRVNLIARIRDGIPPAEYLPASEHMLRRGKRHHWAAPKKVGKSLGGQIHAVDIVLAGGNVVIFDRENGGDLYASRLEAIINGRPLDNPAQEQLGERLHYFEFPRFRKDDGPELAALCLNADLVIFDSQRMYLSDLGLEENSSDDYAEFMAALIDPLFQIGIATLILDNTGHGEPKRGRGASAKGDLNEILFTVETVERFSLEQAGKVRLEIQDSRFGNVGRWELELGAGTFGSWHRVDHAAELVAGAYRFTGKMERCSIFVENCSDPVSQRVVVDAVGGNARATRAAFDTLVREHYFRAVDGPRGAKLVESLRPYREDADPLRDDATKGNDSDTFAHDRVPDRVPNYENDRVPDRVPTEPHNQATLPTASDRVRPRPDTPDALPRPGVVFPYGEPTTASDEPESTSSSTFADDDIPF